MMPVNLSDNVHKHKKEKEIDKFLMRKEAKRVSELKAQVKEIEKVAEIKLKQKRNRDDTVNETENNLDRGKKQKPEIKEILEEINIKEATEKILKHIEKPNAYGKCLNLLKSLFVNVEKIKPLVIVKIFYKILNLPFKFSDAANRNMVKGKYKIINYVDLFEYTIKEMGRIENSENEFYKDIFDLFKLALEIEMNLNTDDNFKFNSALKSLEKEFDSISIWNEQEDTEIFKFENNILNLNNLSAGDSELNDVIINPYEEKFQDPKNFNLNTKILFTGVKRRLIADCFKESFKMSSYKWALPSINNLLKKAYLERERLNQKQLEEIESMVNILNNKNSSLLNLNNTRALNDRNIKNNPLEASHKVTDAREEKMVESSIDTWQAKQSGLTSGKLFMNY